MIRIKFLAIALVIVPAIGILIFNSGPVKAVSATEADAATDYKAKCSACHTPKATKFFDPALADADLVQIVLKGKKGEKPPYMPGFETKGITEDQAKALVAYMRGLREAPPK